MYMYMNLPFENSFSEDHDVMETGNNLEKYVYDEFS